MVIKFDKTKRGEAHLMVYLSSIVRLAIPALQNNYSMNQFQVESVPLILCTIPFAIS